MLFLLFVRSSIPAYSGLGKKSLVDSELNVETLVSAKKETKPICRMKVGTKVAYGPLR